MKEMGKKFVHLGLLVAAILSLSACSDNDQATTKTDTSSQAKQETSQTKEEESSYSFKFGEDGKVTDSIGREVQLPEKIEKVAVAGPPAQLMMFTVAPEMLVGWGMEPSDSMKPYLDKYLLDLPEIGTFYGKNASMNYEEMIKADPDVIIDLGEVKGDMASDLDGLQEQTNIPVVFVECMLDNTEDAYRTLGKLLDKEEECNEQADYVEDTLSDVKEKRAKIDQKKTVYYASGDSGLSTNSKGSIHAEVISYVGGENVYNDPAKANESWEDVSMEQVTKWDPEVIILSADSIYDTIFEDSTWKNIQAVKEEEVYEAPDEPYGWMGTPPNVNRIIGLKWLGNLLYPDIYDYDMVKETKTFYKLFYHTDLSDDEAKDLMTNSTFKK